jgi:hypothetical protein
MQLNPDPHFVALVNKVVQLFTMANLGERSNDTAKMFGGFLKCF